MGTCKSGKDWLTEFESRHEGFKMASADGWRIDSKDINDEITYLEFLERLIKCTNHFTPSALKELSTDKKTILLKQIVYWAPKWMGLEFDEIGNRIEFKLLSGPDGYEKSHAIQGTYHTLNNDHSDAKLIIAMIHAMDEEIGVSQVSYPAFEWVHSNTNYALQVSRHTGGGGLDQGYMPISHGYSKATLGEAVGEAFLDFFMNYTPDKYVYCEPDWFNESKDEINE